MPENDPPHKYGALAQYGVPPTIKKLTATRLKKASKISIAEPDSAQWRTADVKPHDLRDYAWA